MEKPFVRVKPGEVNVPQFHSYLLGAIAPRPIAFASTLNKNGVPNLSPFSFFNVFGANPPIAIFSPARRVRDNTTKHTLQNAKVTGEVVINVVNYAMVQQMSLASTEYPEGINEFEKSGLTPIASELVKPFRVKEAPVQLECKVKEIIETGTEGGAGNLIVCEVVLMHVNTEILDNSGKIDQHKLDLVGRLGADWYVRASGNALFEVAKPLKTLGIGVDNIPNEIKNSNVLTGNDLGKLGNVEALPNETDVNEFKLIELSDLFQQFEDEPIELEKQLHLHAKKLLEKGEVLEAWKTLLAFNN